MASLLGFLYVLAVTGLSIYGLLGLLTLGLYWRHRDARFPTPAISLPQLPTVTVQLPIFNERLVVERLIHAAAALNYPASRLQIQVVDDSNDETTETAAFWVEHYRRQGLDISLIHRPNRAGYKAGALANALQHARGEYVAIFDADFQPQPDFLQRTIPHFVANPDLGMVQARWGHLNDRYSPLTAVQAIALDKHFAMEQTVRHRANLFPKFNGAGGVWRRRCLESAGGWQDDTVCEDLCLSTRAVLKGWEFLFLHDVLAPAELPTEISAYKNQQARWAKGSIQCLLKYGRAILLDEGHSLLARIYALLSMSAYATHVLMLLLLLLQVPLVHLGYRFSPYLLVFSLAGVGQPVLFVLAQQILYEDWRLRLRHFPLLIVLAMGMALSNTRAMWQAVFGQHHPFVRTPKGSALARQRPSWRADIYQLPFDRIILAEALGALYAGLGLVLAVRQGYVGQLFFLGACCLGFLYVIYLTLSERAWSFSPSANGRP